MRRFTVAAAAAVLAVGAAPAFATNGYFAHGYGTHNNGMGGSGAALSMNTMAPATNPAALAFLGKRIDVGVAVFKPNRSYTVTGNPSGFPGTFGLTPQADGTFLEEDSHNVVYPTHDETGAFAGGEGDEGIQRGRAGVKHFDIG